MKEAKISALIKATHASNYPPDKGFGHSSIRMATILRVTTLTGLFFLVLLLYHGLVNF